MTTIADQWEDCSACQGSEGSMDIDDTFDEVWIPCVVCQGEGGWAR